MPASTAAVQFTTVTTRQHGRALLVIRVRYNGPQQPPASAHVDIDVDDTSRLCFLSILLTFDERLNFNHREHRRRTSRTLRRPLHYRLPDAPRNRPPTNSSYENTQCNNPLALVGVLLSLHDQHGGWRRRERKEISNDNNNQRIVARGMQDATDISGASLYFCRDLDRQIQLFSAPRSGATGRFSSRPIVEPEAAPTTEWYMVIPFPQEAAYRIRQIMPINSRGQFLKREKSKYYHEQS